MVVPPPRPHRPLLNQPQRGRGHGFEHGARDAGDENVAGALRVVRGVADEQCGAEVVEAEEAEGWVGGEKARVGCEDGFGGGEEGCGRVAGGWGRGEGRVQCGGGVQYEEVLTELQIEEGGCGEGFWVGPLGEGAEGGLEGLFGLQCF